MDQYPGHEPRWSRRLAWAGAAQIASSVTNFTLYVGLLASSGTADFGRWVAVLAVYHLVVAVGRALVFEPLVSSASPTGDPDGRRGSGAGSFTWAWARRRSGAIGVVGAVVAVAVGVAVEARLPTVAVIALALPFLVHQDGLRSLAWAQGRPQRAVAIDGVWLSVTGAGLAGAGFAGPVGAEIMLLCWLVGGLSSALAGRRMVERGQIDGPSRPEPSGTVGGTVPADRGGVSATRLHARRRSQALLTAGRNLLPIVVATVVGPAAAGLLKAALLPYTPVLSLVAGLRMVVLPAMQRAAEASSAADLDRFVIRVIAAHLVVGGAAIATIFGVVAAVGADARPDAVLRPELLAWGAVVAVIITVTTPLADSVGLGRRSGDRVGLGRRSVNSNVVGRRVVEIGVEWGAVLGAAAVLGTERVVVGWAVGVALGSLLWLVPGLVPAPRAQAGPVVAIETGE